MGLLSVLPTLFNSSINLVVSDNASAQFIAALDVCVMFQKSSDHRHVGSSRHILTISRHKLFERVKYI